jgi:cyclase
MAQNDRVTAAPSLTEVADGVYAWIQPDGTWWINNAGAVRGGDGLVLVDTCATRARTQAFLAALDNATARAPIRLALNTHLHGDHTYGNALLPADTTIIGHERTREGLLADVILAATPPVWSPTPVWGVDTIRAPNVVLRDELTVFTGTRAVQLRHPGFTAHTPGDVVAFVPDTGTLFTGDLVFHDVTPLVFMGSVDGALRSLDWLAGFGATTVVPGHGALVPGDRFADVLAAHERYYRFVLATAKAGMAADRTPLDVARTTELGEFAAWPDQERLVLNLHRVYADAAGTQLDLTAALTDAIAVNGGPLHCAV